MKNTTLKTEILATIDNLHQYKNGYVTKQEIIKNLKELLTKLK
tara:strand:- start:1097 stop:1225 length:129 start_codon:yes stop_codon:yes gene_type:complete